MLATFLWLVIYSFIAMGIGAHLLPHANGFATFLYYILAGTVWIIPVGLALPWMYRDPRRKQP